MADYIKREDAIAIIQSRFSKMMIGDILTADIKGIPSVEPKRGEWIPCEERLPEEDTPVLVAIKVKDRLPKWVKEQTYHYVTDIDVWDAEDGWYQRRAIISAWMPLPQPYEP